MTVREIRRIHVFLDLHAGLLESNRDVKSMRKEFLIRVYGKAADDVAEYYRLIEEQWFQIPRPVDLECVACTNWKIHVFKTGIVP